MAGQKTGAKTVTGSRVANRKRAMVQNGGQITREAAVCCPADSESDGGRRSARRPKTTSKKGELQPSNCATGSGVKNATKVCKARERTVAPSAETRPPGPGFLPLPLPHGLCRCRRIEN